MKALIEFFVKRHFLTNIIFFGAMILSVFVWMDIGKEEMPEFESNWVRVSTIYPGAPAEDVELFVTKPIEDELKGVSGIKEVSSTSAASTSSFRIVIDDSVPSIKEVVQDIKDAVLRADLPTEVRDLPRIRQFKSAEKAILDIGIYHRDQAFLDTEARTLLQKYVLAFEGQLLSIPEVSSIERSHYRKPELQILVDPKKLPTQDISLSSIQNQIRTNNVRVPVGSLKDKGESKVTAINELESVSELKALKLRGNYEGQGIRLKDLAEIQNGFEQSNSIFKMNGHEGVFLNIRKNVATDILTARDEVVKFINNFKLANKDAPIEIVLMDDESYAVTNRLNIVSSNGLLGFALIITVLFIFLNAKAGFWVAMGIPFSMAFTLMIANVVGYTVNNMTLAGIIIVLGIVVDDAIIVAENITRKRELGANYYQAAIEGTWEVLPPIVASILTTCVAFIPLIFFEGFFGKLVAYIPLIVILMLFGSLIESLFILPSHLSGEVQKNLNSQSEKKHWFEKFEKKYSDFLLVMMKFKVPVLFFFILLLAAGGWVFKKSMKFVMFPREESKEVFIKVKAPSDFSRFQTAQAIAPLEKLFASNKENVVAVRTSIGLSRRGGEVKENEASILVELLPADERPIKLAKLLASWEETSKSFKDLEEVKFLRGRWGHGSGNAIEIQVQENNDENRKKVVELLKQKMEEMKNVTDVEVERSMIKNEYLFKLKQVQLIRYNVNPSSITSTLRSYVQGSILYSINKGDEEVDVVLTVPEDQKMNVNKLLNLRVENQAGRLTLMKNLVDVVELKKPVNIKRSDYKRATMIYANPESQSRATPLSIAEDLEQNVFPDILNQFPTSVLTFKGEIEDTRESQGEFSNSILIAVILIYGIIAVMFNSLLKPLLVLSVVPFGVVGVIATFYFHGMLIYGFFATIGALGMIGVVVNDAIIMIDRIYKELINNDDEFYQAIADTAATRLRPILVTTITTVVGILPTAYGFAGYDSMLAEMMLAMGWGLVFGTMITLVLIPVLISVFTPKSKNSLN